MYQADKSDGLSKEGSGRVQVYKKYKILHSYTIECNYFTGRHRNILLDLCEKDISQFSNNKFSKFYEKKRECLEQEAGEYNVESYWGVGAGVC
jgi:hypothetical protein